VADIGEVIDKLIQIKITMMILEQLEGTGANIDEIKAHLDNAKDEILNWLKAKFGDASLKIREMYAVRMVYEPVVEDLVKFSIIHGAVRVGEVEDLVTKTVIYPANIVFSVEEVESGASA